MKRLTAIRFTCRGKTVQTFLMLPVIDGKTIIHPSTIYKLFDKFHGFTPQRGETIAHC